MSLMSVVIALCAGAFGSTLAYALTVDRESDGGVRARKAWLAVALLGLASACAIVVSAL